MTTPTKITFDLGGDQYGRRLSLVRNLDASGRVTWTLSRAAYSQQDDTRTIEEIPADVMRRLVNAAATNRIEL